MALYTNIAGFGVGSWLTDQLHSGSAPSTVLRLDPTSGDIVMFDPGVVLPDNPSAPLPVDQGTVIKYGNAPISDTTPMAQAPTPVTPVPLPPANTPTTTTPATATPAATAAKKNYFPLVLLGGLILMAASSDDFIPKGKRLFFIGGVGLLYYLANKDKATA